MAAQEVTLDQLGGWFNRLNGDLERTNFSKPLRNCAIALASETKKNFARGQSPDGTAWPGLKHPRAHGRGGDKPLRDFDILMASVTSQGKGHVRQVTDKALTFGTNLDYAAIHQWGGMIRPRNAMALTIPLTSEAMRAGKARAMSDLFVYHSDSGKSFLAKSQGKGKRSKIVLHWLLVQAVTVPARPFLGWSKEVLAVCDEILAEFVQQRFGEGRI